MLYAVCVQFALGIVLEFDFVKNKLHSVRKEFIIENLELNTGHSKHI